MNYIDILIIWYLSGWMILTPGIIKGKFPFRWHHWQFMFKGGPWHRWKPLEIFIMTVVIYPWFTHFGLMARGLIWLLTLKSKRKKV